MTFSDNELECVWCMVSSQMARRESVIYGRIEFRTHKAYYDAHVVSVSRVIGCDEKGMTYYLSPICDPSSYLIDILTITRVIKGLLFEDSSAKALMSPSTPSDKDPLVSRRSKCGSLSMRMRIHPFPMKEVSERFQ